MRYALISDVHGNLPALEAVLEDLDGRADVDGVWHLGDLVGDGPWPNEVVAVVRAREIGGVAGTFDCTVAADRDDRGFRHEDGSREELGRRSLAWTRAHVGAETRRWLGQLPFRIELRPRGDLPGAPRVVLVHALPERDGDGRADGDRAPKGLRAGDVLAFGHSHRPSAREVGGVRLVGAGSVGRPEDGDPRACYALVEVGELEIRVEHVRVEYDVERAAEAVRRSGLPDAFAGMLERGEWFVREASSV